MQTAAAKVSVLAQKALDKALKREAAELANPIDAAQARKAYEVGYVKMLAIEAEKSKKIV